MAHKFKMESSKMVEKRHNQTRNPQEDEDEECPFTDPVVVPLEDSIDLHSFGPEDIPSVVEEYLEQCREAGVFEVRLIHGRGIGVQRRIVRTILERHPSVRAFKDAPLEAGGWGATVVELNPK